MSEEITNTAASIKAHTRISARDKKGAGGAFHFYTIAPRQLTDDRISGLFAQVKFQKGPIAEHGVNGCTNEDLLAIVDHRLECFQAGSHPCDENEKALEHVKKALGYLHRRTRERQEQGVEGTNARRKSNRVFM
jgi:hypothetical protein